MSDSAITAIVLAAGQGTRMKTNIPKVLHPVLGEPMLGYVLDSLNESGIDRIIVVVGHMGEQVIDFVRDRAEIAWQKERLGTGHAVKCALPHMEDFNGEVIITCGDAPLVSAQCFRNLIQARRRARSSAVVATMELPDPKHYGRITRDRDGNVMGIVEFKDASDEQKLIREVNTGTYCFQSNWLRESIARLNADNAQGEYYLTDTISNLLEDGRRVTAHLVEDPTEFLGVNDALDLSLVEEAFSKRIKHKHLTDGVIIEEIGTVRIGPHVKIGTRTRLRPGVILEGETVLGEDCVIGPHVMLRDVSLPARAQVAPHSMIGPSR
ncbi:MAG: bifunctional N-acetylglucosamine-1-phosphate uridyltransferase/glucosamine-1-phosphate acetyltransferase [Candidatus Sumerlaeia bacterium]|nr:bifunctional N-acetylglucosamine-1-phosphate uridyltransferase/glucosamine-1-phosphate acetyltransferase [Candidatus Sumerlaeia bacterium]